MARVKKILKVKCIPTERLKAILDENYTRGINGADYEELREEMQGILWERQQRNDDKLLQEQLKQLDEAV